MPFIDKPKEYQIGDDHETIGSFLGAIVKLVLNNLPHGMYVVLFDDNGHAHGYQFGLEEENFAEVGLVAERHREAGQ